MINNPPKKPNVQQHVGSVDVVYSAEVKGNEALKQRFTQMLTETSKHRCQKAQNLNMRTKITEIFLKYSTHFEGLISYLDSDGCAMISYHCAAGTRIIFPFPIWQHWTHPSDKATKAAHQTQHVLMFQHMTPDANNR